MIETERISLELANDSTEPKPLTTRKLRRRPNEPIPIPEKRRRVSPNILFLYLLITILLFIYKWINVIINIILNPLPIPQLNLLLDESDIMEDLKILSRANNSKLSAGLKKGIIP